MSLRYGRDARVRDIHPQAGGVAGLGDGVERHAGLFARVVAELVGDVVRPRAAEPWSGCANFLQDGAGSNIGVSLAGSPDGIGFLHMEVRRQRGGGGQQQAVGRWAGSGVRAATAPFVVTFAAALRAAPSFCDRNALSAANERQRKRAIGSTVETQRKAEKGRQRKGGSCVRTG